MKRTLAVLAIVACCSVGSTALAHAQMGSAASSAPGSPVTPAATFDALLTGTEGQMMSLVKAMPADKYGFAPSAAIFAPGQKTDYTGVRTFGALVLHVAQANYGIGGMIGGLKPDVDVKALASLTDKEQIVSALAASFAYVHKSIATLTPENAFASVRGPMTHASAAAFVTVHASDEYGQMVEYLRMNGMVPPASEKK